MSTGDTPRNFRLPGADGSCYTLDMIETEYLKDARLLRMTFSGKTTPEEVEAEAAKLEAMAPQLEKGFRVLTDLTHFETPSLDIRVPIARMMQLFNRCGVSEVIRVIPDPSKDIGLNIMSLFHYGSNVKFRTVTSCNEV